MDVLNRWQPERNEVMTNNQLTSTILNIQKFSLHDGPGIRTVVFFKGCPLRCRWCANPESQDPRTEILWDRSRCLGCGVCIQRCPSGAISKTSGGIRIDTERCSRSGICIAGCPGHALQAEGEQKTAEEVLQICLQDKDFYEESGGGVTLSGGEALLYPGFAVALIQKLKEHGIHTAIETTGFAAPEVFDLVIRPVDLLLFDIKHWDEKKHKEGTGVSNRLILDNMKRVIAAGKQVLPRLPVIPGYNSSLEDAAGFAMLLKETGAKEVQLLPFHQFGEGKYDRLGKQYAYAEVPALHEEDLMEYRSIFWDQGIHAFF